MSRLKWNWVYYPYLDAPNKQEESALKAGYIKVVLKSEADKVIAHHKYKRCLDNARWCKERYTRYNFVQKHSGFDWSREIDFYFRWHKRWLELAEKFKEAE